MIEVVSVHIGKTAGTTFLSVLSDVYGSDGVLEIYNQSDKQLYASQDAISKQVKAIHGHFSTNLYQGCFPDAKWVVWLRHPIFRLISQYFYSKTIKAESKADTMNILEFAELPGMQNRLSSYVNQMKLADFYFVGMQEFFLEDITELKEAMGWPEFRVSVRNSNRYSGYQESLQKILGDSRLISKLASLNNQDMELYQTALDLRAKRRNESKWCQQTLADWNRSKFLIQGMQERQQELEMQLEQSRSWLKLRQAEEKVESIEVVKVPFEKVSELILGFGVVASKPEHNILSDSIVIRGWVLGKKSPATNIVVLCNNEIVSQSPVNKLRAVVAQKYPNIAEAKHSGFEIPIEVTGMQSSSKLALQVSLEDGSNVTIGTIRPLQLAALECV